MTSAQELDAIPVLNLENGTLDLKTLLLTHNGDLLTKQVKAKWATEAKKINGRSI